MRARQTTEILAAALGAPFEVTDALREFDCGIAEGCADEAAWALWHCVMDEWLEHGRLDSRIDGGESHRDIQARFVPFVDRLQQAHHDSADNLILLGHGGLFLTMLPVVLANIDVTFVANHSISNTGAIIAESRSSGLVCLEWCGEPIGV